MYNSLKVTQISQEEQGDREDAELLSAAQQIYDIYYGLHSKVTREPLGVAVNPKTGHGQVLFTKKPILLPGERFIPIRLLPNLKNHNRFSAMG